MMKLFALATVALTCSSAHAATRKPSGDLALAATCKSPAISLKAFSGSTSDSDNGPVRVEITKGGKNVTYFFGYHDHDVLLNHDGVLVATDKKHSDTGDFGEGVMVHFIPFGDTTNSPAKAAVLSYAGSLYELKCTWEK